jgi:hypothetical protein
MISGDNFDPLSTSSPFEQQWPVAPAPLPLISGGVYRARCLKYEIFVNYRFPENTKLHLHMEILDGNESTEETIILTRFLNYSRKPGRGSDYYSEWVIANNGNPPKRGDRMHPKVFEGKVFEVKVRSVKIDRDHDALLKSLRYSVIGKIVRMVD